MSDDSEGAVTATLSSPLAGLNFPQSDTASVAEAPAVARLVLRVGKRAREPIGAALGVDLEMAINRAAVGETCSALRLGPDEWLILADAERDPWLTARIGAAAGGAPASLVDVTHRSAGLVLEGPGAEDVLAAGCPLPLDLAGFPAGRATRTLFAKVEVVLWRRSERSFHLEVGRSYAPYLVSFLGEVIADEAAIDRLRQA